MLEVNSWQINKLDADVNKLDGIVHRVAGKIDMKMSREGFEELIKQFEDHNQE